MNRHDVVTIDQIESTKRAVGRVEIIISTLLRVGVISSLSMILLGLVLTFARHPEYSGNPEQLTVLTAKSAPFPHSVRDVFAGVRTLQGQAVIALGLLILIITPVLRVAISIVAFAIQHDQVYVAITCIVLALLILSFVLGHAEV
jgi:uncharacterized membrane protein